MAYETGTCTYIVLWKIITHTSGNELRGPEKFYGEFESESDAIHALVADADYKFSRSKWGNGWKSANGYTDALIKRYVEYDFN